MGTVIKYKPEEWIAMGNLKSSIALMKGNNETGKYDNALAKQKSSLKYFLSEVPERVETA